MNYGVFTGNLCTVPSVSFIPIKEKEQIYICKFIICTSEFVNDKKQFDFFECVSFEDTARTVCNGFSKGAKINVFGKIKNFTFKDVNHTAHFTNIVLAEHIEFGDSSLPAVSEASKQPQGVIKFPVIAELGEMDRLYEEVCRQGFLCIDEKDYCYIALNNMSQLNG